MKRIDIKNLILKHKRAVIIVVISAIVVGSGAIFIKGRRVDNNKNTNLEAFERIVKLEKGDLNESIIVSGSVKSGEVSNVSASVTAKVKSVNVKVGEVVKAGDVICILDDSDIVKEIENKKKAISDERESLQNNYNKLVNQLNSLKNSQQENSSNKNRIVEAAAGNLNNAKADLSNYESSFNSVKSTYNIMINAIGSKQSNYDNAESNKKQSYESWLKSGGSTDSQEYKNYVAASEALDSRREELDQAKALYDYDNVLNKYNEALEVYNEKVNAINSAKIQYDEAVAGVNSTANSDKAELDGIQASVNEAYNQIQKLNNNDELKELEEKLSKTVLKAETDGKITDLKVNVGGMAEGTVATIQSTDKLILSVNIPEYDIQKVKAGMKAEISSDTLTNKVEGELVRISPVANSGEGSSGFSAEIAIKNGQGMFIGTNAKAEVIISGKKDVILAPIDAVKNIDDNPSIFVREADGKFKEMPVIIGGKNDYYVEVSGSNIKEGIEINASLAVNDFDFNMDNNMNLNEGEGIDAEFKE